MTSTPMGRVRISLYLDEEILESVNQIAELETRSAANLIEHLTIQHLRDRGIIEKPPEPTKIKYEKGE